MRSIPSILAAARPRSSARADSRSIFAEIDRRFDVSRDAEVTFEANPDSVTLPMLMQLRRAGFNRISIGVQSDHDAQLKALGRPHNYQQAQQAVSARAPRGL